MRRASLLALAAALGCAGCLSSRPATVPMPVLRFDAPGAAPRPAGGAAAGARCLVVLLPGIRDAPEDFERHGFTALARERGVACDLEAADGHVGYFRNRSFVTRLHDDVIAPARARGYDQVYLVGVSLGGLGSLLYARGHAADVAGLVLIAPYLGDEEVVREVESGGGLRGAAPAASTGAAPGREASLRAGLLGLWGWLRGYADPATSRPPTWLLYGKDDRYAPAMRLFAQALPPERVIADDGRHDWDTWRRLWIEFLGTRALPGQE